MNKILLVVDLQKQFMDKTRIQYNECLEYIAAHRKEYNKIIGTIFSQSAEPNSFKKYLNWDGCLGTDCRDIEYIADQIVIKGTYGVKPDSLDIKQSDRIYVMGCDSDACILATAFLLFDGNYDFRILCDHIYSSGGSVMHDQAINILRRQFGKAVVRDCDLSNRVDI